MIVENLNKKYKSLLSKYFDNYCLFFYGKLYPMTETNVINYFQALCEDYFEDRCQFVEVEKKGDDEIKVSYLCKGNTNPDSGVFIQNNALYNLGLMDNFNEKINDNKPQS